MSGHPASNHLPPLTNLRSLIAHPKDRVAALQDVQSLPFFSMLPFATLRQIDAPFVPVLDGETDVGYFDSFSSPEDMAKYAEVFKKQRDVEAVEERGKGNRNNWVSGEAPKLWMKADACFRIGRIHVWSERSGGTIVLLKRVMLIVDSGRAGAWRDQGRGGSAADDVLISPCQIVFCLVPSPSAWSRFPYRSSGSYHHGLWASYHILCHAMMYTSFLAYYE